MARENGILEDWHDARGFGFIRRPDGSKLYVHMKSIGKSIERPKPGDKLSYEVGEGANGRPAAVKVQIKTAPAAVAPQTSSVSSADAASGAATAAPTAPAREQKPGLRQISMRTAAAATLIVLLGNNIALGRFPVWVGLLYVIGGIASWLFYQTDKRAAAKREWRAPERSLHLADLAFGIIGGLLAQHVLRHKTYKPGFVMVTALITALHVLTLGLIMLAVYVPGGVGDFFRRYFGA
ncbi:MAG: hypothetical protein B7Z40_16055 [Bosea sp. 12-68-7]|nr:MAG: hypothetical protein B7Z40_16055 [Bosea sp. 12-68-7]